ncbi:hypothetical protein AO393_15770 [Pseudomonas syringae pv. syringae]|nr:hypothetical protein AL063_18255 [Pseudomonas syringae pv. syringae]PHN19357.1 hypothetical protein AO256_17280 [Pseudomonas syringae]PHX29428.1 hypothetical protein AO278_19855 [Pseudomonas syringae pv. syringae]PHX45201.1 hypothetical protein AO354_19105 [Pseudomonas syringae pv. syringae]PHX46771.1 hypothetical protein AO393_15770 [Pseudomonas syringae pv. syringae]
MDFLNVCFVIKWGAALPTLRSFRAISTNGAALLLDNVRVLVTVFAEIQGAFTTLGGCNVKVREIFSSKH